MPAPASAHRTGWLRAAAFAWAVVHLAAIGYLLARLHGTSAGDYDGPGPGPDVQAQLNWIAAALRAGAGEATQAWYPEGYFFAHAIYGYALVNQALLSPDDEALRARNLAELDWVLQRLESEAGRAPFTEAQAVPYGVFYQGWVSRLLGGRLRLQRPEERDAEREAQWHAAVQALAEAMAASPTVHLEAYPGGSWPVDNVVALSALRLHDALYGSDYGGVAEQWLSYTRGHLDPATGLIPHRIDANSGRIWQGARASSLVMTLAFLPEVDAAFAAQQYRRFRELFAQPVFGFGLLREYPKGTNGPGDVDSGPLIFGLSPISTGVGLVAARANGDVELFERLLQLSEVAGLPITAGEQKRYSLGRLMVGDAFLAWGKTWISWGPGARRPAAAALPRLTPRGNGWAYAIAGLWAGAALAPAAIVGRARHARRGADQGVRT